MTIPNLRATNIPLSKAVLKMMLLFPRCVSSLEGMIFSWTPLSYQAAILLQFHTLLQSRDDPTTQLHMGSNTSDFAIMLFNKIDSKQIPCNIKVEEKIFNLYMPPPFSDVLKLIVLQ